MSEGFVFLHRKSIENPIFQKPLIWHYFEYCLLKANHSGKKIIWNHKELDIKRGSFITGRKEASRETGLSEQNIRTAIKVLVNSKMIEKSTSKSTSKFTYLTVCNYSKYQSKNNNTNQQINQQVTSSQPASNQQVTTNNNDNNNNNKKNDKNKNYSEDSNEFRLASYLYKNILDNDNKFKKPNLQSWSDHFEKLIRIDQRTVDEIKAVILWVAKDNFWSSNILSASGLRKKFPALIQKWQQSFKVKEKKEKFLSTAEYNELESKKFSEKYAHLTEEK